MSHRRARPGVITGKFTLLKFSDRASDLIDQLLALVVANHRAKIAALLLRVDFRKRGRTHPPLKIGPNITQELRPLRRVRCQNSEISMVAVKILDRPAIG